MRREVTGHERVARDARGLVVGLAEPAVDDDEHAARLDGVLAGGGVDGGVAVDDHAVGAAAELLEDHAARGRVLDVLVVGVARLFPGRLVREVGALEGLHHAAGQRREAPAPQVPHPVERDLVVLVPRAAREAVGVVVVLLAREHLALVVDGAECAVLVHGHARVEEHVAVVHEVCAAVVVEEADVGLELLGVAHGAHHVVHDLALALGQLVGVLRVEGGEVAGAHRVLDAVDRDHAAGGVHVLEEQPVVHLPVGVAEDHLALELEEDDRDRLLDRVHAVVLAVGLLGEHGELAQAHAVGVLEDLQAVVVHVVADHGGQTGCGAGGRAHPHDVVVAPLDVDGVVGAQAIDDAVGARPAVEDVADEVQVVDGEAFDQRGERADEVVGAAGVDDRADDALMVGQALLVLVGGGVEQLIDDVGVLDRHGLADLRARVGAREPARQAHEAHEVDGVPLLGQAPFFP